MDSRTAVIATEKAKPLRVVVMTQARGRELAELRVRHPGFATYTAQQRMLDALATGPVLVIEAERYLGIRNPPDIVMRIRKELGIDVISERIAYFDEDGNKRQSSLYSLPD